MATDTSNQDDDVGRLPPELKSAVVQYLTTLKDRQAVSLLNKDWALVVMPIMWETFTTDLLVQTGSRNVLGLASPTSNIVKHVRRINLLDRPNAFKEVDQLPLFLAAIPRDQLHGFKSGSGVHISTLELLLQMHPRLEHFDVGGVAIMQLLVSPWIGKSLSSITRAEILLDCYTPEVARKMWTRFPKLKHLHLARSSISAIDTSGLQEDHFGVDAKAALSPIEPRPTDASDQVSLQLLSLRIDDLRLPNTFSTMFKRIDIIFLKELILDGTKEVPGLLEAMCIDFQKRRPSLRKMRLITSELISDNLMFQLQLFLLSFHGLHQLHIQHSNCNKIDVDGIINHGETLTDLTVVNGGIHRQDSTRCMNAGDLQKVAIACPNLQQLCVNLYEVDSDTPEGDFLGLYPTKPSGSTDFENALSAVASIRSLRLLRLTNPPNYRKIYHRQGEFMRYFRRSLENGEQRFAFQARADSLVRYLGDRGSNIRLLAFSPIEALTKAASADKNGHVWPDYFYACERMKGHRGTELSIARAARDWKAEIPEAAMLDEI
jgi:hypothetical protein